MSRTVYNELLGWKYKKRCRITIFQTKRVHQTTSEVSILMPKIPSEFRRPATVLQRCSVKGSMPAVNKHNDNMINGSTKAADWEVRQLSANGMEAISRFNGGKNSDAKKAALKGTELPILPIANDVLANLPACKISNLRLTSQACPSDSPPPEGLDSPTSIVSDESNTFKVRTFRIIEWMLDFVHFNFGF